MLLKLLRHLPSLPLPELLLLVTKQDVNTLKNKRQISSGVKEVKLVAKNNGSCAQTVYIIFQRP